MLLIPVIAGGCGGSGPQLGKPASAAAEKPAPAEDWRAYGEYLKQRAASGEFSGSVLVAKDGRPLLERGYGMADRKRGVANTARTRFCIASMGKMFTAVAVAQLVERGKLSFDDTIGKYVSGFPREIAGKVTVHQLLTHTSGMGDALKREGTSEPPRTIAGLMKLIAKEPLLFEPGSRFGYSNSGFIVLGAIIERVTGKSYAGYVREHVFKPAGMTDTAIRYYRPAEIRNMAHGYVRVGPDGKPLPPGPGPGPDSTARPETLRDNSDMPQIGNPSGGAYSTVGDMLAFARALTGHKLLGPALTKTVLTGKVDTERPGGPPEDKYAYGFGDRKINGVRIVGHNGGTPGYEGQLDIYLDKGYTVIILTNQDGVLVPAHRRSEEMLTR
ncbi:serine hydrolase domain-containing protein [Streptosporangium subroseum]|uniref:serine hydrolase domain-containing protein n=1 Tax=Streptosporangium subroseum TaxID=106412 RepID=UPI00341E1621